MSMREIMEVAVFAGVLMALLSFTAVMMGIAVRLFRESRSVVRSTQEVVERENGEATRRNERERVGAVDIS